LLEKENPAKILKFGDRPILEANPNLTGLLKDKKYLEEVVFTCGVEESEDSFIIASGELDLYCRITHLSKTIFI